MPRQKGFDAGFPDAGDGGRRRRSGRLDGAGQASLYDRAHQTQQEQRVLKETRPSVACLVGKPWDRQPVSGKLRRKPGVSPGFAAYRGPPPPKRLSTRSNAIAPLMMYTQSYSVGVRRADSW